MSEPASMSLPEGLRFERDGAIARLTLHRPNVGNSLDVRTARALMHASIECDEDTSVRCVVLSGTGRLFCAGGDIGEFAAAGDSISVLLKELTTYLNAAVARFARMRKPIITAVNGPAAGAGLSLAMLGDLVLAVRSAHFTVAYTALGLSPDCGATWWLPRLVGLRVAQELILTNRRLSAEEAKLVGLITRVVDDNQLVTETDMLANQLANSAPEALAHARRLLMSSFDTTLETQMDAETRSIAELGRTECAREGIRQFLEKRRPDYSIRK
jgi:2-(1,2-epoxy-1,2-dihydrophenyl)acetyl-CoA isomerase